MDETPLDRIARALGDVPIRQDNGVNVYLGLALRIKMAHVALSVLKPENGPAPETHRRRGQPTRVLPAKFVTEAMAGIPDALPPDLSN